MAASLDEEESSTDEGGAALATRTVTLAPRFTDRLGRSVTDEPTPRGEVVDDDAEEEAPPEAPIRPPSADPVTETPPTLSPTTPRLTFRLAARTPTPAEKVDPATANVLAIFSPVLCFAFSLHSTTERATYCRT